MFMSHTHAVLASGVQTPAGGTGVSIAWQGQHRHHESGTSYPFPQSLVCIIHVYFHYWTYHSLPFPENSCIRKMFCLKRIRMSIFCNSASKITYVSPWVLSMIINTAVKLKGSKIALVFLWRASVLLLSGVPPEDLCYIMPANWTVNIKFLVLKWKSWFYWLVWDYV